MEAFIATGNNDATEYLEFEVAPNDVIWSGFIHNPNKDFSEKATAFVDGWETYPITHDTEKDEAAKTWTSKVSLPLTMFNVESPGDTEWRMNFFRTYFASETSEQEFGAWNPNKLISFHQTPCFGVVTFEKDEDSTDASDASVGCSTGAIFDLAVPNCSEGSTAATVNEANVEMCYTDTTMEFTFDTQELDTLNFIEAFIAIGDHDPTEYMAFEVDSTNLTWAGFIHNPAKDFSSKATAPIEDWESYPITFAMESGKSTSKVSLPFTMFNLEEPKGTDWRMNFFRAQYAEIGFHETPCFGRVRFGDAVDVTTEATVAVSEVKETTTLATSAVTTIAAEMVNNATETATAAPETTTAPETTIAEATEAVQTTEVNEKPTDSAAETSEAPAVTTMPDIDTGSESTDGHPAISVEDNAFKSKASKIMKPMQTSTSKTGKPSSSSVTVSGKASKPSSVSSKTSKSSFAIAKESKPTPTSSKASKPSFTYAKGSRSPSASSKAPSLAVPSAAKYLTPQSQDSIDFPVDLPTLGPSVNQMQARGQESSSASSIRGEGEQFTTYKEEAGQIQTHASGSTSRNISLVVVLTFASVMRAFLC
jgi:hypothetical protein